MNFFHKTIDIIAISFEFTIFDIIYFFSSFYTSYLKS